MSDNKSWDAVMERERRKVQAEGGNASGSPLEADENASLPDDETEYKASSFQASRGLVRLCIIMGRKEFAAGGKPYRAFQYVHLDSDSEFGFESGGQVLILRFAGLSPVTITVRGRNLLRIWDYIQLHRMAWIRVADRDFTADEAVDDLGRPLASSARLKLCRCCRAGGEAGLGFPGGRHLHHPITAQGLSASVVDEQDYYRVIADRE